MPTAPLSGASGRDRAAAGLLLIAALGALVSFIGAVGTVIEADPATRIVESWRAFGFLVFAGLFTLLALRPRRYVGVWEVVIVHKAALAITAATLVGGGVSDARLVAAVDGTLAVMLVTAYVLARGYAGWAGLLAADA